jgi:hypothetical protein
MIIQKGDTALHCIAFLFIANLRSGVYTFAYFFDHLSAERW